MSESAWAAPAAPLRGLIAGYSGYRQHEVPPATHRGLPSPYLTLIITLDDPLTIARHPDPADPPGRYDTLAGGLHTTPALITHDGRQSGVQIALSPLGARALFGMPAAELARRDLPATEVLGLRPVGVAGAGVPEFPSRARRPGDRLRVMTAQNPPPQVWPALRARDARALIRFLVAAFGFEETVVYGEGDRVDHAQLSWPPGGGIMLGSARENHEEDSWPVPPGSCGCYVVTDEPDALFERAVAAGAEVIAGLHDTDYGSRDFAVRDPEGNRWSFGSYRGEPRKG